MRYIKHRVFNQVVGKWHEVRADGTRTWCGITAEAPGAEREQDQEMYPEAVCVPCRRAKRSETERLQAEEKRNAKLERRRVRNGGYHRGGR